jgi:hypothetical protein
MTRCAALVAVVGMCCLALGAAASSTLSPSASPSASAPLVGLQVVNQTLFLVDGPAGSIVDRVALAEDTDAALASLDAASQAANQLLVDVAALRASVAASLATFNSTLAAANASIAALSNTTQAIDMRVTAIEAQLGSP